MVRALLALAVVLVAVGVIGTDRACACSCARVDPRERLATADAAVIGTVLAAGDTARLRVEERFAGEVADEIELPDEGSSASCAAGLEEGERVGLFLTRDGDGWATSLCDRVDPTDLRRGAASMAPLTAEERRLLRLAVAVGRLIG